MKSTLNNNNYVRIGVIIAVIIIGLWVTNFYLLKNTSPEIRGTYGDMFGVINSLFSGLALAGIILTILLQRNELVLQRQELQDTRMEFHLQNQTLSFQRFENIFFQLLSIHHQIVNDIDEGIGLKTIKGRDVFRNRYRNLRGLLIGKIVHDDINKEYLKYYNTHQTDFGHYFRNLYRIIKLIDLQDFSTFTEDNEYNVKYKYTSIVRAQLSNFELLWLFYNCISDNGIEKFKPLIERYTLFKNIPITELAEMSHEKLYLTSAFKNDKKTPNT